MKGFFTGLEDERQAFMALAEQVKVAKGSVFFLENDPSHWAYYLEKGAVRIFRLCLQGKEPTFFIRGPGDMFGLAEVAGDERRKCSAQAMADCEVWRISRDRLLGLMAGRPGLALRVIEVLGQRLRALGEQLEAVMTCGVASRLLRLLCALSLEEVRPGGPPLEVELKLTQEQLASMTGSCQQTVSETLARLEAEGLIKCHRRGVTLVDPAGILRAVGRE